MKKSYVFIILFLFLIILITIIGSALVSGNISIEEDKDILAIQSNKEVYFDVYGYSIDNPNVIVNPYGNSPLTALVMFETSDYSEVEIFIKSKSGNSDISYKFDKDKYHRIPIYGLYADYDNTIVIRSEGIEKVINIKTDKLPDDFIYVENMIYDNFMFYNSNYPYAIDNDGEIRWYLNEHYFGNITNLDNSSIIIGSDRYNEDGNTISFYKMNLLGKIYNEYLLSGDYYGYSVLYEDNVLVLSDKILLIDIQTGKVIRKYIDNDGYDYLSVYEDNIIIGKDNVYYSLANDTSEEVTDYTPVSSGCLLYDNTSNYNLSLTNRSGSLKETLVSDEKILLFNYDKFDVLENISVVKEVERIKVINNNEDIIYLILDKFMDKRVYEVSNVKYINTYGLEGKYTVYFKIDDKVYKTNYYVEV